MNNSDQETTYKPKWVFAQKLNNEGWVCKYLSFVQNVPSLEDCKMLDEVSQQDLRMSEFAVFKYRDNWMDYRPVRYISYKDRSNDPIIGLGGLISSLPSDFF